MNTSTEHILLCNQSEPLADTSGRIVDLMNENATTRPSCSRLGDNITVHLEIIRTLNSDSVRKDLSNHFV